MNGPIEIPDPGEPSSNSLESLTAVQLAELGTNPEKLASVRAEVCQRLKDSPNKANYLTFRWFLPADDEDKADAFDGLMASCWNATKIRNPSGLFPLGYPDTYCGERKRLDGSIVQPAGGVVEESREAIMDALVDCLYDLRAVSVPEVIQTALNGGFHTDADVGNALRSKVREKSGCLFKYGGDPVGPKNREGGDTLIDNLPDPGPGPGTDPYSEVVEIIFESEPQVVEKLGEEGWEVLEEIVNVIDNDLLPQSKRERQRLITEVFARAYNVNPRQARTYKSRFLEAVEAHASDGKPIFEAIVQLFDWLDYRYDCRESHFAGKGC